MVVCANAQAHTQLWTPMSRSAWTQGPTYTKICKYICTIPAYSHLFSDQGPTANWFNESWHLGNINLSHWLCFRGRICPEPLLRNKAPHSWLSGSGFVWPQLFLSRHPQLSYQRPCLATQTTRATQQPLEKTETSSQVDGQNDDALLWRRKMIITPTRSWAFTMDNGPDALQTSINPPCAAILWVQYNHLHFQRWGKWGSKKVKLY